MATRRVRQAHRRRRFRIARWKQGHLEPIECMIDFGRRWRNSISFFGRYVRNRVGNLNFTVPSKLAALRTLDAAPAS
jgi:hypothetical protein